MASTRRRNPTLDDVAESVGVSRATVSNAYNRPDQLSSALRDEVLRAADRLGYPGPNPVARSLATKRSGAIAVLLDSGLSAAFSDPALSITLDALSSTVDPDGHALLLLPGSPDGGPRAERVLSAQADLAVATSLADDAPALRAVRNRGLPLVVIDEPVVAGSARVDVDDHGGAASAARHLLELGHRRFGILSGQCLSPCGRGSVTITAAMGSRYRVTRERLSGYTDTLASAGIDLETVPVWESPWGSHESARLAAIALLERDPRPTALLCMSDELALGALAGARSLGLDVPGGVSVVGFDDTPAARWAHPPLTTVRQDLVRKGTLAGTFAQRLLAGQKAPEPVSLPVELVVRESSGPAAE